MTSHCSKDRSENVGYPMVPHFIHWFIMIPLASLNRSCHVFGIILDNLLKIRSPRSSQLKQQPVAQGLFLGMPLTKLLLTSSRQLVGVGSSSQDVQINMSETCETLNCEPVVQLGCKCNPSAPNQGAIFY